MFVTSFSHIRNQEILIQGESIYKGIGNFADFSEAAYRKLGIQYPRFHKMDPLCKLGFLGSDILLNNNVLASKYDPFSIGVVLSNSHSSLDTDLRHLESLESGVASPAVFVYSLPNIVIGEICIRNRFKGENTFFVSAAFDIPGQVGYISLLFEKGIVEACLGGWVEKAGENYQSFLYVVEKTADAGALKYTIDNIRTLYTLHGA